MTSHPFLDWRELPPEMEDRRVYLGSEACLGRLPGAREIRKLVAELRERGLEDTWVFPPCGALEVDAMMALVDSLTAQDRPGAVELVCNDWGLLHACSGRSELQPIVGRFLVPQALDPRWEDEFLGELDDLDPADRRELLAPRLDEATLDLFREMGVFRLECSWTPWLEGPLRRDGLSWSVLSPFVPLAFAPSCFHGRFEGPSPVKRLGPWHRCPELGSSDPAPAPPCLAPPRSLRLPDLPPLHASGTLIYRRFEGSCPKPDWADRQVQLDAPR